MFERALQRFGDRHARAQYDELSRLDEAELKPTVTRARIAALGIAGVVALAFLLLLGTSLYLIWPMRLPDTVVGVLLMLFCLVVVPRPRKLARRELITAEQAPALFSLIERISSSLGCRLPDHIAIDGHLNASFGMVGWRRRSVMTLGLPLWTVLRPQERVCLIGHELAHGINGDPARGFVLHTALRALFGWAGTLQPDSLMGAHANFFVALAEIPFRILLTLLARAIEALASVLLALIFHESQRAEYLADALEARVGGTGAAISLFERLSSSGSCIERVADRISYDLNSKEDFFDAFGRLVDSMPPLELERQRRLLLREDYRLDATHPPTAYRIRMLERHAREPAVTLSEQDSLRIDAELAPLRAERQEWLLAWLFPYR